MNSELDVPGIENADIVTRDRHTISRKDISPNALKVLYRLLKAQTKKMCLTSLDRGGMET